MAQRTRDHQQAMWVSGHELETMDECATVGRAGMDQVREIFPFHHTDIFPSSDGVISRLECLLLDSCEPPLKSGEAERILLAGIHQENRMRHLELRTAPLGQGRD